MAAHHPNHHLPRLTSEEATRDLLARVAHPGPAFWPAAIILGVLALVGIVALVLLLAGGPEPRSKWGYSAAVLAFLVSAAQGAPILALASRAAKGYWAITLRRATELFAVSGLVTTPLFVILLFQLPEWEGRWSIWFDWPGAPLLWDSVAMITLTLTGLALLWMASLPDLAAARDARLGGRFARLALGWVGTDRQWNVLTSGIVVLGAFYLMLYIFVHVLVVSDLAISLTPGWHSAVIPPYHAISGFQGAIALTLVTLGLLRRFGGLERYMGLDPFWGASKILLALSLLFFYLTWSELLLHWYGRQPYEIQLLTLFMFGPYLGLFILTLLLNFLLPFLLLIFNSIRVSIGGPVAVGAIVLLGNLVDRIRIYVASWSVIHPPEVHVIPQVPPTQFPVLLDVLVLIGMPAAVGFLYLLALRVLPPISLWEYKTGLLFRIERRFYRGEVAVVAKPR